MSLSSGRFIIGADVVTPTGMNLEMALSVAKADLSLFSQKSVENKPERFTYANVEFLSSDDQEERSVEMLNILINSLLKQIPKPLKPIPLYVSIPDVLKTHSVKEKLEQLECNRWISNITLCHSTGIQFLQKSLKALDRSDALLSICVDSLYHRCPELIEDGVVMSDENPWGLIPSEGAGGLILTKANILDTLKIKPLAEFGQLLSEHSDDRRGMMRLIREVSKTNECLGNVYSNMTNKRSETEAYGFAIGARAEKFTNPQQPFLINTLWGSLGESSVNTLISTVINEQTSNNLASLFLFSQSNENAIITMKKHLH
ncbi:hypothetical protein KP803_09745 [Vibrio sp. ZSDE26]|uniref:Uncharacterized protein n=1 Tax=Vibrio amylolyticus TaxID=2847292 RepID=A0A9X1XKG8_9VIBR|nr:hypothetical protein [Vibrio amylolyticus]MCK6263553.1 hypothetical protein [Vibrio amylolyticus]